MADWLSEGIAQDSAGKLARIFRTHARGDEGLGAEGYEGERPCGLEAGAGAWRARVWVMRSPGQAARQAAGLARRRAQAETKLAALTPARGRGKRQSTDEATRLEAMDHLRKAQRGDGWLTGAWERQAERHTHDGGRGRGSAKRAQRVSATIRSHMTRIARREDPMAKLVPRFGGKALVTTTTPARRSLADAGGCSRNAYRIERMFHRLKSRGSLAPLFVKRDDPRQGLTSLLTLGVRVFTVREVVLRRSLEHAQATRPGLPPENRMQRTDTPTAERLLKAFADVSLPIFKTAAGANILQRLTPFSALQQAILQRLGVDRSLYQQLEIHDTGK